MTDDRLSALAIISVENKTARSLDYDALIKQFADCGEQGSKEVLCVNAELVAENIYTLHSSCRPMYS